MKFKNYIETESGIKDTSNSPGTAGQLLSSTVTGTSWIDQNTISSGSSEVVDIQVKNISSADGGVNLSKGDPVYIYGSVGASARLYVDLADSDSTVTNNLGDNKMPCVGLLDQDLAPNEEGTATVVGKLRNLITSPIDGAAPNENDTVYVKPGGGLTLTKPAGSANLIQNVGQVGRVSTSADGNIVVAALLRSNDIPNLPTGRLFVGTAANTSLASDVVYVDDALDRVGIGTNSPQEKLHIYSTGAGPVRAEIESTQATDTLLKYTNSIGSYATFLTQSGQFSIYDYNAASHRFYMLTNGNIGIGTTSPGATLEVTGKGSNTEAAFKVTDSGDSFFEVAPDNSTTFKIGDIGGLGDEPVIVGSYSNLKFNVVGNTTMTLESNNRVGIGTTSPRSKLHVEGVTGSVPGIGAAASAAQIGGSTYGTLFSTLTNGTGVIQQGRSDGVALTFPLLINPNGGNVGIGTTSATSAKLVVAGNVDVWNSTNTLLRSSHNGSYGSFQTFTSGSYGILVLNPGGGNVGIGTTSPQEKLHVQNYTNGESHQAMFKGGAVTTGNYSYISLNNGYSTEYNKEVRLASVAESSNSNQTGFAIFTSPDGNGASGHERLRVSAGGNVGIGTTSPDYLFEVEKSTGTGVFTTIANFKAGTDTDNTGAQINVGMSSRGWFVKAGRNVGNAAIASMGLNEAYGTYDYITFKSGNVGIRTTNPSYQLQLASNSAAKPSSSLWTVVSDSRVKENIRDYTTGLEAILKIEPKIYDYNGKAGFEKTKDNIGIIAQDMQTVMPETIKTYNTKLNEDDTEDTELLNFDGHAVTFALINAVKDLKAEIEELKKQINK